MRIPALLLFLLLAHLPLGLQAAATSSRVDIVYAAPGCDSTTFNTGQIISLMEYVASKPGNVATGNIETLHTGLSAYTDYRRYIVPEARNSKIEHLPATPEEILAGGMQLIKADIPVLVSPFEVNFELPLQGEAGSLSFLESKTGFHQRFPDSRKVSGQLYRYQPVPGGPSALVLELPDSSRIGGVPGPVKGLVPTFLGVFEANLSGQRSDLYSLARTLGGASRMKAELERLSPPGNILLHPGDIISGPTVEASEAEFCGKLAELLKADAMVPGRSEFQHSPKALIGLSARHHLPMIAANVRARDDSGEKTSPFPGAHVFRRNGREIAVIGLAGRDIPHGDDWIIDDPAIALRKVYNELSGRPKGRPDLIVVLTSMEAGSADLGSIGNLAEFDVLFFRAGFDAVTKRERIEVLAGDADRRQTRYPQLLLRVANNSASVGRISVSFSGPGRLSDLIHLRKSLQDPGPRDPEIDRMALLQGKGGLAGGDTKVLLPDVTPFVRQHPEIQDLVWGDHVLLSSEYSDHSKTLPARFTAELWMRFVVNTLRTSLTGDVVLSRNLFAGPSAPGPTSARVFESRLSPRERIFLVTLNGTELRQLCEALDRLKDPSYEHPERRVFTAGLDLQKKRVAGRAIDRKEEYRLIVTESVMQMSELVSVLGGKITANQFIAQADGTFRDLGLIESTKKPTLARPLYYHEVLAAAVTRWKNPETGQFDPAWNSEFEARLLDASGKKENRWTLQLDELSLSLSQYKNTDNVRLYSSVPDTRLSTQDYWNLTTHGAMVALYDTVPISWENRVALEFAKITYRSADGKETPKKTADSLVPQTEVRFNIWGFPSGIEGTPLVPFVQLQYDTELSSLPGPNGENLPRKSMLRPSLGLVVYPSDKVRELRAGFLQQNDMSVSPTHRDFGVFAQAKLEIPLYARLRWRGSPLFRYFFPSSGDRSTDLGMLLQFQNKLITEVGGGMSFFFATDHYLVRGKTPEHNQTAGSNLYSSGLEFSHMFKP